jgi:hypothetical protein
VGTDLDVTDGGLGFKVWSGGSESKVAHGGVVVVVVVLKMTKVTMVMCDDGELL